MFSQRCNLINTFKTVNWNKINTTRLILTLWMNKLSANERKFPALSQDVSLTNLLTSITTVPHYHRHAE